MINPRISTFCSTTKQIAQFSCTPHVQDVHTKAEVELALPFSSRGTIPHDSTTTAVTHLYDFSINQQRNDVMMTHSIKEINDNSTITIEESLVH